MSGPIILLGPQRPTPNLTAIVADLPGDGPVLTITAGWRYDESDREALDEAIGADAEPLPLYAWFDEIVGESPALARAYKERQREVRKLKELYRLRLKHAMDTVHALQARRAEDPELVEPELEAALEMVRAIDESFLIRSSAIQLGSRQQLRALEPPRVARRRTEAARRILEARAVLVAGGHVGVLRNRLMFFELDFALRQASQRGTAVLGWSAGAMVLTDRVLLFYDDPPEGHSYPELLDRGLGLVSGLVALPHARRRLNLEDRDRVSALAGRFESSACVGMENGAHLVHSGGFWENRGPADTALLMSVDGSVDPL